MTILSVNDIDEATNGDVTVTMSQENAIRMLHFANFGRDTMNAVNDIYRGNSQWMDLKMDNLEDLKEQLGVSGKKTSNLVVA